MDPATVLAALDRLGGELPPTYVVGCRPVSLEEGIGLTEPVAVAVPEAMAQVRALLATRMAPRTRGPQTAPARPREV
jgi:hydrogenase maturation protease